MKYTFDKKEIRIQIFTENESRLFNVCLRTDRKLNGIDRFHIGCYPLVLADSVRTELCSRVFKNNINA